MTSVSVDNNASTLTFTINLASDPSVPANNWGTHLIGFDTTSGGNGNIAGARMVQEHPDEPGRHGFLHRQLAEQWKR